MGTEMRNVIRRLLMAGSIASAQLAYATAQTITEQEALARARGFSDQVVRVVPKHLDGGLASAGFGIIVGDDGGKIYIATPRHVVFGDEKVSSLTATPSVVFHWAPYSPIEAQRLDVAIPNPNDLAVVTVPTPRGLAAPHAPMVATEGLRLGAWVWNIGVGGAWETPDRAGGFGGLDAPTNLVHIGELRTPPGASGGAGVTENGVIGMVLLDGSDYSLLLPIERIVSLFQFYRLPVNLLVPVPRPAAKPAAVQTKGIAASFCDDLKGLLSLTGEEFASIREGSGSDMGWSTQQRLFGFKACNVQKTDNISFGCQGDQVQDKNLGYAQVSALINKVSKCLGLSWSTTKFADNTAFSNLGTADNVMVSLYPLAINGITKYYTNIMIYRNEPKKHTELADITPPTKPEGYCDALKLLVKAGDTQFSELMGKKVGDEGEWRPKVTVANWNECLIYSFDNGNLNGKANKERRYFTCELGPFGSKSVVEDMAKQVVADIKGSCLPDTWTARSRHGRNDQLYIEFESADAGPTVEVRTHASRDGSWDLSLDVNGSE